MSEHPIAALTVFIQNTCFYILILRQTANHGFLLGCRSETICLTLHSVRQCDKAFFIAFEKKELVFMKLTQDIPVFCLTNRQDTVVWQRAIVTLPCLIVEEGIAIIAVKTVPRANPDIPL